MDLKQWIGRTETSSDLITATPYAALSATFDRAPERPPNGTPLPPLWHWLYFLPIARQSAIGPDGHAHAGTFLPPVPLPRRMWAGNQLELRAPLRVGDEVTRVSTIEDVSEKSGRSGNLVFVKVRHDVFANGAAEPAVREWLDIVHREEARPDDPVPAPKAAPATSRWKRRVVPDPVLLFRYSALTFNGHKIHYDYRHATQVERYPGLVVHGPLLATLLLDLLRAEMPEADVATIVFRANRPTFDTHDFFVCGEPMPDGAGVRLWGTDHEGWLTMDCTVTLRR